MPANEVWIPCAALVEGNSLCWLEILILVSRLRGWVSSPALVQAQAHPSDPISPFECVVIAGAPFAHDFLPILVVILLQTPDLVCHVEHQTYASAVKCIDIASKRFLHAL